MTCGKCGHGRQWHRLPDRVSGWQRERRERPTRLACRFTDRRDGQRCKCRDWRAA